MVDLVVDYRFELVEDHHSAGSGRYGVLIAFSTDVSEALPYLNSVLEDTRYDHEGRVLIGRKGGNRLAVRPHEIRIATIADPVDAPSIVRDMVELVNRVWAQRDRIARVCGRAGSRPCTTSSGASLEPTAANVAH